MVDPVQQTRLAALLQSFEGSPAPAATPDSRTAPGSLRTGATVQALITAVLPDGRSVIDVDGAVFQTRLPAGTTPAAGDRLRLVVLQTGEHPTFSMASESANASSPGARVEFSALAAQLKAVAEVSAKASLHPMPAVVSAPVIPEPATPPTTWTEPLRHAIERSGMFYESHQAQWVAGQRPQSALAAEPQAAFAPRAVPMHEGDGAEDRAADGVATAPAKEAVTSFASSAPSAATPKDPPALPPGLAVLVDRQLQTLSSHQVQWSGTVWPGQTMDWRVEEDRAAREAPDETPRWSSRLRLSLPRLGEFDAVLDLRGGQLQLKLAVTPGFEGEVKRALPALQAALRERGLEVVSLAMGAREDA